MSRPKILWFGIFAPHVKEMMREMVPEGFDLLFVNSKEDKEEHLRLLEQADYIAPNGIKMTDEYIRAARHAKLIQLWGAGVDAYNQNLLREMNIALQNGVGLNAPAVAEMVMLHVLALNRHYRYVDSAVRSGKWVKNEMRDKCNSVYGKTVGLIGMGNIGRKVAQFMHGLDVDQVFYYDIRPLPEAEEKALGVSFLEMDEIFRQSDIVSLHVPLTDATRKLVNRERLAMMKPSALLINTARGGLVDEAALYEALSSGKLRGAGLDTFDPEPPKPDNPLFTLDNVSLTSHGGGAVVENIPPRIQHVYDCIVKFEKGEPVDPKYVVLTRQ